MKYIVERQKCMCVSYGFVSSKHSRAAAPLLDGLSFQGAARSYRYIR